MEVEPSCLVRYKKELGHRYLLPKLYPYCKLLLKTTVGSMDQIQYNSYYLSSNTKEDISMPKKRLKLSSVATTGYCKENLCFNSRHDDWRNNASKTVSMQEIKQVGSQVAVSLVNAEFWKKLNENGNEVRVGNKPRYTYFIFLLTVLSAFNSIQF